MVMRGDVDAGSSSGFEGVRGLERGFSFVLNKDGNVAEFTQLKTDDEIDVVFDGGRLECVVRRVIYDEKN